MTVPIQQFFKYGLDRTIPALADPPLGEQLNLGPGSKKLIHNLPKFRDGSKLATGLGMELNELTHEFWMAGTPIPRESESIAAVHAYQFMEHLEYTEALEVLREIDRVLMPGGVAFIVCPHAHSQHFTQALDHKTMWTEETWDWLFGNDYYTPVKHEWKIHVHACFLMGVVYRNLDVFTQLVKE
jgi:SAM-dependent methyltransferase